MTNVSTGDFIGWDRAWAEAATGPAGFWQSGTVGRHFRTASSGGLLAELIGQVLDQRPEICRVIEIGAGDGQLLTALNRLRPDLELTGIDLRPQPHPDARIEWLVDRWDSRTASWAAPGGTAHRTLAQLDRPTMIICCEWLDELPCAVAVGDGDRWREVLVRPDGRERLAGPVPAAASRWLLDWVGDPARGVRAEIGLHRDRAWQMVIEALRPVGGAALMIDYSLRRGDRPAAGTLTAYADGRQHSPRPDPRLNLTAHVAVDAVVAAGVAAGARTQWLCQQADVVDRLAPTPVDADPLHRLQAASERRALSGAFGRQWWLLQTFPR